MSKENFEKALQFLFPTEGGYINDKDDFGGPTNMGVTQDTYDFYLKNEGLPTKDVKEITKAEAIDLYYKHYWKESGADEISDPNMAITLFDTAVLHGPGRAKQFYRLSKGDLDKYLDIRQTFYDKRIKEEPSQKKYYRGWNNRVNNLRKNIQNNSFVTNEDIDNLERIFTAEEIGDMSNDEYALFEKYIDNQLKTFGIPRKSQADEQVRTGDLIWVNSYTRSDGTEVSGYYRQR